MTKEQIARKITKLRKEYRNAMTEAAALPIRAAIDKLQAQYDAEWARGFDATVSEERAIRYFGGRL